jgi:hypothetical protein
MSGSDLFCVADDETKKVVIGFGVPESKIRVTGFPVSLAFTEPLPQAGAAFRRSHPLPALHHGTPCGRHAWRR